MDALRDLSGLARKDGRTRRAGRRGRRGRSFLGDGARKLPEQIRPGVRRARYKSASGVLQRLLRSGRRGRRIELDAEALRRIRAASRIRPTQASAVAARQRLAGKERARPVRFRSEEHTSELQSLRHLVCRLLLEKKKK